MTIINGIYLLENMSNNVLVLAPHGDDEVLGCGGSIAKHIESGDQVTVAFIKAAYDERSTVQLQNTISAQKVLDYERMIIMNLDENTIHNKLEFIKELEVIVNTVKPDTIYSTFYGDLHQDHRALFEALNTAARVWADHLVKKILLCETISSTDQGIIRNINPFVPNYYVTLSDRHIDKKIDALSCYEREIKKECHPRSIEHVLSVAKSRGREIRNSYAEAFMLMRFID
jgi:N-acetylglucosamine malate deacetylase 1